jgi:peptidoglycan hydrolase-like protein with peptidoglycan-binding domain
MNLSEYKEKNTKGIAGLSNQLCAMAVKMGFLVPIEINLIDTDRDSLVHLYLHPKAYKSLITVSAKLEQYRNDACTLILSTAYRTLAQQFILLQNKDEDQLVARVGRSDHGNGRSIDVTNWENCQQTLRQNGWNQSYPDRDPIHWDYPDVPDNRSNTILAFQKLFNLNSGNWQLTEDGNYGEETAKALSRSPCNGFKIAPVPRYLSIGDTGNDVGVIQLNLKHKGFYSKADDMLFGSNTESAVMAFQKAYYLPITGIVDNVTGEFINSDK